MNPTNSTTSGPFILWKLLTNIFQRIVSLTSEDKLPTDTKWDENSVYYTVTTDETENDVSFTHSLSDIYELSFQG